MRIYNKKMNQKINKDAQTICLNNMGLEGKYDFGMYKYVIFLICTQNKLTELVNLSKSINHIDCKNNKIMHLDNLPPRLRELYCNSNDLENLNKLPQLLNVLVCSYNRIANLNNLPPNLTTLICSHNLITELNNLPLKLKYLDCSYNNKMKNLDYLPDSLTFLNCQNCHDLKLDLGNMPFGLEILQTDAKQNEKIQNAPKWNKCGKIDGKNIICKKSVLADEKKDELISFSPTEYNPDYDVICTYDECSYYSD